MRFLHELKETENYVSDFEASDELGYSVKEYRALMREDELQAKRRKRQCERELA